MYRKPPHSPSKSRNSAGSGLRIRTEIIPLQPSASYHQAPYVGLPSLVAFNCASSNESTAALLIFYAKLAFWHAHSITNVPILPISGVHCRVSAFFDDCGRNAAGFFQSALYAARL